ncbi:hypothetical protein QAD02_011856 [Eretmocerus hayati]|uniref:Uncharacterized protein n=1 Tax=Eretmocerus hayati TaxID=131215 RepID=A0ACC2NXZ0_9HYME|nr:hypothetical protein QAD02_011856 [Eretmocerus hayati]
MDPSKRKIKDMPSRKLPDLTDVTVVGTPLPQASSTVDRKSLLHGKARRSNPDDPNSKHRQLNFDQSIATHATEQESSLGIIQNISDLLDGNTLDDLRSNGDCPEREREIARNLLKKCDMGSSVSLDSQFKSDKENNVNSSNLTKICSASNRPKNTQSANQNHRRISQYSDADGKSNSTASVSFEPNEISARSSELNKTPEKTDPFPSNDFSGISYNSNLAEIMQQYGDEDFVSGSKAGSQILADEISWKKNQLPPVPLNNNNDRNRLEHSCFSGIVGGDVTIDETRISAGEFFRQNGGNIGHLSASTFSDRVSLGLDIKSPKRRTKLRPLVDQTSTTEDGKESKSADQTKDPSVMSLTSIAQILQDLESATPQRLADQMLEAGKKKRRHRSEKVESASNTYTILPSSRASLPASVNNTMRKENFPKDVTTSANKLSLGGKDLKESEIKHFDELLDKANFIDPKLRKLLNMSVDEIFQEQSKASENQPDDHMLSQLSQDKSFAVSLPRADLSVMPPPRQLSYMPKSRVKLPSFTSVNNESSLIADSKLSHASDPTMMNTNSTNEEVTLMEASTKSQSFETKKVRIGKKTQEICTCLVNIPREADFELLNETDRWIICRLKLGQIQGEKENIKLEVPHEDILIEPDAKKSFKIGVRMPHMGKLTIATFQIHCSDMVTRAHWTIKHLMCFVPEELDIKISLPSQDRQIDFGTITDDSSSSLTFTLENKNTIDIPVVLRLNQGNPQLFNFGDCLDETLGSTRNLRDTFCTTLKPKQPVSIDIDFKGMSLQSFGDKAVQTGMHNIEAKLEVSVCSKENGEYPIEEVSLRGSVGCCKLDIVDTQFPMTIQPKVEKTLSLVNSGSVAVSAMANVVQSKEDQSECRDFLVFPNNIVLNGGEKLALQILYKPENNKTDIERHAMIKIAVGNKVSFYPVIGEKFLETEQVSGDSFHLQRSETPQRLRPITSPTSPHHSLVFNRSGNSGRYSPGSTASGGTTNETVIPIRATHTALVWGSIKIGRSDTKSLTIRNTSNNKIKLLVTIEAEDQNFKILKDRAVVSTTALSLQGMESKTLYILFAPNHPRAAAGKLIFSNYSSLQDKRKISGLGKRVQLFGYGGFGRIEISEAMKDTSGQMWLSLGKFNSSGILHGKIKLHNSGDLTCFTKIKLAPKALYPSVTSSWFIDPTELILAPDEVRWVSLEFKPRRDDITMIHQTGVIHVGSLKMIYGDEPTRLRIRRLHNKLKDSGQLYDKNDDQTDDFKDVILQISKAFPGEAFTQDLRLIGDSVQNIGDLCKGIVQSEVKLTIEMNADETMSVLQDNMDESQAFYSLCSDHDDESHYGGESFLPAD